MSFPATLNPPEGILSAEEVFEVLEFSRGLMSMLEPMILDGGRLIHASMDDVSTSEHGGMSAVVGYVAHTPEWHKFNYRWMISLLQLQHPALHTAKDVSSFPLIGGSGLTDEDVFIILSPFIAMVQEELIQRGAFSICVVTEHAGYDRLTEKEKKFIRPPDINSFEIACAYALKCVSNPLNPRNCIAIQMDESQSAPKLYESYQNMKRKDAILKSGFGSICFCDDIHHPPIQAADLLGNVTVRGWRNWKLGKEWPKAFKELVFSDGKPNLRIQVYDYAALKELARIRMAASEKMAMLSEST